MAGTAPDLMARDPKDFPARPTALQIETPTSAIGRRNATHATTSQPEAATLDQRAAMLARPGAPTTAFARSTERSSMPAPAMAETTAVPCAPAGDQTQTISAEILASIPPVAFRTKVSPSPASRRAPAASTLVENTSPRATAGDTVSATDIPVADTPAVTVTRAEAANTITEARSPEPLVMMYLPLPGNTIETPRG